MSTPPQVWNPNTPANGQENLSVSAPKIKANFNAIGNTYGTDHVPLGSATNVGFHNQTTFATQTSVPTADPNNIRLFSQLVGTIPEIFIQYPGNSGITQLLQLTSPGVSNIVTYTVSGSGGSISVTEVAINIAGFILYLNTLNGSTNTISPVFITYGGPSGPSPYPNAVLGLNTSGLYTSVSLPSSTSTVNGFQISGFSVTSGVPLTVISWGY